MLFVVAAIVTTSMALGPTAIGVVGAPSAEVSADIIAVAPPFVGPQPVVSPDELVTGGRLLQQLSLASAPTLSEFFRTNPQAIEDMIARPPAAREVGVWWQGLDTARRDLLRSTAPRLVGNLDGIPVAVRDLANRDLLSQQIASLTATVEGAEVGRTAVDTARRQLTMLAAVDRALDGDSSVSRVAQPVGSRAVRTLLELDVSGQGRAAIVIGDLRTADYVTFLVPGMFFTIENQMVDWADAASRLRDAELDWLSRFHEKDATVATVAWIGYHTPNLTNVGGIENAYEGRDALAAVIQGVNDIRHGSQPYISIVAHSYGSTAALMALTEYSFSVDALVVVGSPGSPAKSVDDLNVRDGNVFVGEAAWDPIPNSSYFGSDPGSERYGAKVLGVAGGEDPITGESLSGSVGHNEYFSEGSESMRNFALIAIGRGDYVSGG